MKNVTTTIYLVISGLILLVIGGTILLEPHLFHGSNGIALGNDPNLLSEIRAPGGLLACSGITILMGAFRNQMRPLAATLSILVYGSFGMSRLVSMGLDGIPSSSIVGAAAVEVTVAIFGVYILWRARSMRLHAASSSRSGPEPRSGKSAFSRGSASRR